MKELLVIGGGGHGRIIAEAVAQTGLYRVIGFGDDDPRKRGVRIDELIVLGPWSHINADAYIVAIGNNEMRRVVFERLVSAQKSVATIIHPRACVSQLATVGLGTVVLAGAVIQAGARLSENVIVNVGVVVDHDAQVGSHAHLAVSSTVVSFGRIASGEVLAPGTVRLREGSAGVDQSRPL